MTIQDLKPHLDKLFVGPIEQIRVSDLELKAKRKIPENEQLAWAKAGVFKTTFSIIYDYNNKSPIPSTIESDGEYDGLKMAAAKIAKTRKIRKTIPTAVDDLGLAISTVGVAKIAELNGIDMTQYAHLDNGRRRMVIGNILRSRKRKGLQVCLPLETNSTKPRRD